VGPFGVPGGAVAAAGASTQVQPASSAHDASQPSPGVRLPSSHASLGATTRPSPHTGAHVLVPFAPVVHAKPGSTAHADEQPSPSLVLPSSHVSAPSMLPSPHSTHTDGSPVHEYDVSIVHKPGAQPSPASLLASSHCSIDSILPLPHVNKLASSTLTS